MARQRVPITVIDLLGNAVSGASITVVNRVTSTNATLYAAETGATTVANPTTTDSAGRSTAWVDRGSYNANISGTGITSYTQPFESDNALDPPVVTTLPGSPYEGQEIHLLVDSAGAAGGPMIWPLRYYGAAATYKWVSLGAPVPYMLEAPGEGTQGSGAAPNTVLNSNNYSVTGITVPFAGIYNCVHGAGLVRSDTVGQLLQIGFYNTTTMSINASIVSQYNFTGPVNSIATLRAEGRITATAAGQVIAPSYFVGTGTGGFGKKFFQVAPVRIG